MKEEMFSHPGESPRQWGDQTGWRGSLRATEDSTATGLQMFCVCIELFCYAADRNEVFRNLGNTYEGDISLYHVIPHS